MFDLVCQICTEPFEHYYVVHEMGALERDAFLNGEGCIACDGNVPDEGISEQAQAMTMFMDVMGDDLDGVASMMEDYQFLWS